MNGQIDVYWEYTGTSLIVYNKINEAPVASSSTYNKVKKLDAEKGVVWLNPSAANNTYALVMNKAEAKKLDIHTISDLAKTINGGKKLTFAADAEFAGRADGLRPLEKAYGFMFRAAQCQTHGPRPRPTRPCIIVRWMSAWPLPRMGASRRSTSWSSRTTRILSRPMR